MDEIPLSPPDPRLIQELFDKDPLELGDQDIDTIIAYLRQDRLNFLQPAEEKAPKAKASKAKAAPGEAPDLLSLLDL